MKKTKMLVLRITQEQDDQLKERSLAAGFWKKSEYTRTILFRGETDGT